MHVFWGFFLLEIRNCKASAVTAPCAYECCTMIGTSNVWLQTHPHCTSIIRTKLPNLSKTSGGARGEISKYIDLWGPWVLVLGSTEYTKFKNTIFFIFRPTKPENGRSDATNGWYRGSSRTCSPRLLPNTVFPSEQADQHNYDTTNNSLQHLLQIRRTSEYRDNNRLTIIVFRPD